MKNVNSTDRIKILYSTIRVDNLENAETLFPGQNIISQSNMDNIIPTNQTENENNHNNYYKKSDKGLSTGGIVAIIVPLAVILVAVAAFALISKSNQPQMAYGNSANSADSSIRNLNIKSI